MANSSDEPFSGTILTRAAAYGFSLGATGAIVGALNPGEKWTRVVVRPQVETARTEAPGFGFAFIVSL